MSFFDSLADEPAFASEGTHEAVPDGDAFSIDRETAACKFDVAPRATEFLSVWFLKKLRERN